MRSISDIGTCAENLARSFLSPLSTNDRHRLVRLVELESSLIHFGQRGKAPRLTPFLFPIACRRLNLGAPNP